MAWLRERHRLTVVLLAVSFLGAGAVLGSDAQDRALRTPLRALLDSEIGGFSIDTPEPGTRHDPLAVRARLIEDASQGRASPHSVRRSRPCGSAVVSPCLVIFVSFVVIRPLRG